MKIVCFIIHGVGSQHPNFAVKFRQTIDKRIKRLIKKKTAKGSAVWKRITQPSQLVEYHELYWANVTAPEQDDLYRKVCPEAFMRRWAPVRGVSLRLIGDVFSYLGKSQEAIKRDVFNQFVNKLKEMVTAGEPFSAIIVGHSLGSVILHDIISGLEKYRYTGLEALVRCTSVFTMGSPISLFSLVTNTLRPREFLSWVNFMNPFDPIAFRQHNLFESVRDVRLHVFSRPWLAHTCYWSRRRVHSEIVKAIENHVDQQVAVAPSQVRLPNRIPPEVLQPLQGTALSAGFSDYEVDFNNIPFGELIEGASRIDICNVYGSTWYRTNAQYFVNSFKRGVRVRVCMLSPDSPALRGFCHHFSGMAEEKLKEKIADASREIRKAYQDAGPCDGQLKLYSLKNIINHGFYRFDDLVYFVPRPISSPRNAATPIPGAVFRISAGARGFASWVMKDFEAIFTVSGDFTLDFDSSRPMIATALGADATAVGPSEAQ